DFYTTMVRTDDDEISCLLVAAETSGLTATAPEQKMGLTGSTTTQLIFDDASVDAARLIGDEGDGLRIALESLGAGRLGIAACAVGLAQAALDEAVSYANQRAQFGHRIIEFQGVEFMLADMAAAVESSRSTYHDAARCSHSCIPFHTQSSLAKR